MMADFRFYFSIGWEHILSPAALDHFLFLAALAVSFPLPKWKQLLWLVTAFTVGHSISLLLSVKQWIQADAGLVEFLIPITIIVTATANLLGPALAIKNRRFKYVFALVFGLIHGLAFANTLRMILADDQSFGFAMFSFSIGVEAGQLLLVTIILLLSALITVVLKLAHRYWIVLVSIAVLILAIKMAVERRPRQQANGFGQQEWRKFFMGSRAAVHQWSRSGDAPFNK